MSNSNISNGRCLHLQGICKIIAAGGGGGDGSSGCCLFYVSVIIIIIFFSSRSFIIIIIRNELLAEYRMSYLLRREYFAVWCSFLELKRRAARVSSQQESQELEKAWA